MRVEAICVGWALELWGEERILALVSDLLDSTKWRCSDARCVRCVRECIVYRGVAMAVWRFGSGVHVVSLWRVCACRRRLIVDESRRAYNILIALPRLVKCDHARARGKSHPARIPLTCARSHTSELSPHRLSPPLSPHSQTDTHTHISTRWSYRLIQ